MVHSGDHMPYVMACLFWHGRIVSDQVQVSFDTETHYPIQIYKNKKNLIIEIRL